MGSREQQFHEERTWHEWYNALVQVSVPCLMPPFAWAVDWDIIYCHDTSWKDDAEWTLTYITRIQFTRIGHPIIKVTV